MATGNGLVVSPTNEVGWRSGKVTSREAPAVRRDVVLQDFERAYESYAELILRYCNARIGNLAEAEDAAASVFSRALAAWPPNDPAAVRSWLFAIAHNVVVSHYRLHQGPAAVRPLDEAQALTDRSASPEESAIQSDERTRLLAAIEELGSDQRQVVTLRLAGLTGREIAETIGRSHAAVKMLQHRAVQNLRGILALADENPASISGYPGKVAGNDV